MSEIAAPAAAPASNGAAPAAPTAPQGAPSGAVSPNTSTRPAAAGGAQRAEKPAREPIKVKHKHVGEDGNEMEFEIDLAEHLSAYKRKIKSDKEEREVSLDEAFEKFPLADGAFRRMEESAKAIESEAKLRKSVEVLGERLKDPKQLWDVLERLHGGPERVRDLVLDRFASIVAEDKLTPEQKAAKQKERETERAYAERERALKEREGGLSQREKALREKASQELQAKYAKEWPEHLARHGIKSTPRAMAMMAELMGKAKRNKIALSEDACAKMVRDELRDLAGGFVEQERKTEIEELNAAPGAFGSSTKPAAQPAVPVVQRRRDRPPTYDELREENAARDRAARNARR